MHERRFNPENKLRLRSPERLALLEVARVVNLTLEGIAAKTLLDVGSGSGVFAEIFSKSGLAVHGVDVSPRMIAIAREFLPGLSFEAAPVEDLPYRASSFDIVFMGLVLHETDDALQALIEAQRVAVRRVSILEWRDEEQDFGPPREHRLSVEKVSTLSQQAGFEAIEIMPLENLVLYRLSVQK